MSIRTIIEINHDYLHELAGNPEEHMCLLIHCLMFMDHKPLEDGHIPGIRRLGQRHHSETLKLEVK